VFIVTSLKAFNEDFNTLEVFAFAHDEVDKLSGQLLLDVANRLPGGLKRRYLGYVDHAGLNMNRPGFDSLRKIVVHELNVMTSDYAQIFFKQDDKEKSRDNGKERGSIRVRQVALTTRSGTQNSQNANREPEFRREQSRNIQPLTKLPPNCFVCNDFQI